MKTYRNIVVYAVVGICVLLFAASLYVYHQAKVRARSLEYLRTVYALYGIGVYSGNMNPFESVQNRRDDLLNHLMYVSGTNLVFVAGSTHYDEDTHGRWPFFVLKEKKWSHMGGIITRQGVIYLAGSCEYDQTLRAELSGADRADRGHLSGCEGACK